MANQDSDYDKAAKALVDALLGKRPEPEPMKPLPSSQPPRQETWEEAVREAQKQITLPATLPNDTSITQELATSGAEMRFEVETDGKLVAFTIPIAIVEMASEDELNAVINKLALEVIVNGYINLAALERRLSPDVCVACGDLGWKTQKTGFGSNSTMKWIECPYCNNRYEKPQPNLGDIPSV